MAADKDFTALEKQIGHNFKDRLLLVTALTHSSAGAKYNYERLEFLGDRVLGLVIANLLYKRFPEEAEGDLAKRLAALVQGSFLAGRAHDLSLGQYVEFSEAEALSGGADNENILADVFESLIGALYLDSGLDACETLIEGLWNDKLDVMKEPPQHPKTRLQEWAQSKGLPLPSYKIVDQQGPDHAPIFVTELSIEGYEKVAAQGKSRQQAEKNAAQDFVELLRTKGLM